MTVPSTDGTPAKGLSNGTATVTTNTTTLTNSTPNAIIVAVIYWELNGALPTLTGVSGGGLTWTKRSGVNTGGISAMEVWWALAASPLSGVTVTATFSGNQDNAAIIVVPFKNVNTSTPWDSNVSIPATQTSGGTSGSFTPSLTVSTTNNDCLLLYSGGTNQNWSFPDTVTPGFTSLATVFNPNGSLYANLEVTSAGAASPISSVTETWGSAIPVRPVPNFGVGPYTGAQATFDALVGAGAGPAASTSNFFFVA